MPTSGPVSDEELWEDRERMRELSEDEEEVMKNIFMEEQRREILSKEKIMSFRLKV